MRELSTSHAYSRARRYLRAHGIAATAREAARRAVRRARMGDLPATVHVEISNVCNLDCEYCVLDQGARGDRIMSEATFSAVLPYLRDARRVDVSGLAEPLMNTRWPTIVRAIRGVAPRAHVAMCSNASLLDSTGATSLIEAGVDELVFSLDGVDPAVIDEVRRGGSLSQLIENIRRLGSLKAERGSTLPHLSVTVVQQRSTVTQLPDTVRLAAELGATSVSVNGLEPYTDDMVDQPVWTDPDRGAYMPTILQEADSAAQESDVTLRLPWMRPLTPAVCPQIHRPIVLADGTVVPCSVLAYERRSLLAVAEDGRVRSQDATIRRRDFGNVNDTPLKTIWTDAAYRGFRKRVTSGAFPEDCSACLLKHGVICPTPPLTATECLETLPSAIQESAR